MSHRLAFVLGFGLLACSEAGEETSAPGESLGPQVIAEEAEVAELELLHDFSIGSEQIALLQTMDDEGNDLVVLRGMRSAQIEAGVVERLREQEPEVTFLELFYTLAPSGMEPNPTLVSFHGVQVQAFGRADTSVRRIEFDRTTVVEKSSASCTAYADSSAQATIGDPWPTFSNQANMTAGGSLSDILCHANNGVPACDKLSNNGKLVAVCSDGPSGHIWTKPWWRYEGSSWKKDSVYVSRPPGTQLYYWLPKTAITSKWHVLGIEIVDPSDAFSPAYFVRARDAI